MVEGLYFVTVSVSVFTAWAALNAFLHSSAGAAVQLWWFEQRTGWFQFRFQGRLQAGEDRYFEELRAIEASAPRPPDLAGAMFKDWRRALACSIFLGFLKALEVRFR